MKKFNAVFFAMVLSAGLMAQTVTSVSPNIGHEGSPVTVTIVCAGMNFTAGGDYSVTFNDSASGGLYTNFQMGTTTIVSSTTISNTLTIPSLVYPLGPYTIVVMDNVSGRTATALGKFRITGPTGIDNIDVEGFRCYPLPASGLLHIEAASLLTHISLTSLSGQLVLRQAVSASQETIDIRGVQAGMYILSATDHTGAVSFRKITIE